MKRVIDQNTEIRNQIWPSGEQENLVAAHDLLFQEARADIAKWVKCEQVDNLDLIEFCHTFFKCGMTVIPAPKGAIRRVFTVANHEYCDPVYYRQVDISVVECQARNFVVAPVPTGVSNVKLPLGYHNADPSTDAKCGRARVGVWAVWKGNIYMFPWIQSNELVAIEWDGIKEFWGDNDLTNNAQDYRKALKLYMQYAHERDYGTLERAAAFLVRRPGQGDTGLYADALADLMYQCEQETKLRETKTCENERPRLRSEITDDAVPVPASGEQTFAHISNTGCGEPGNDSVADLVKSWVPNLILSSGNTSGHSDYDLQVGRLFHDYLFPYNGVFGSGAPSEKNLFYPAPGELDWDIGAMKLYFDYFHLPYNERYYDVVRGPVHFFIVSSDPREPSHNTQDGPQGVWLQAKLAASTAPWKIVLFHHPPYSSGQHGGATNMRWPFAAWGASAVICGHDHDYERLSVDGIPYFVNGLGGRSKRGFSAIDGHSVFRYSTDFGAMRISAEDAYVTFEFFDKSGTLIDDLTLGTVPGSPDPTVIGCIGDFGGDTADEADVADLVKGWNPDSIVTVGDNIYPMSPAKTIDEQIGKYYAEFIGSYTGAFGSGSGENRFFPALGNHDWDGLGTTINNADPFDPVSSDENLDPFTEFFTLPGNERYYELCTGSVHFFFIDTGLLESDGTTFNSVQATWLRAKLALSTAPWKVVVLYKAPFSSTKAQPDVLWPFGAWGAHMVLSGQPRNYERFDVAGVPFIVNGLGGDRTRQAISSPALYSKAQYSAALGAGKLTATETSLKYEFFNVSGAVVDSVTLNK